MRMFVVINVPFTTVFFSEKVYPAVVNALRFELVPSITISCVLLFVWGAGAVWLTARYLYDYIGKYRNLMRWWVTFPRDAHAESLLAEIIGTDKHFRIYRGAAFRTAAATAFKPYIILPNVEIPDDELRVILLHEWKHIQDKDYVADIIIHLISFIFWWNPLVYILKRNCTFARELKCDSYAVPNQQDFHHLLDGLVKLNNAEMEKMKPRDLIGVNTLIGKKAEFVDRLTVLGMRWEKSRRKWRFATNIGFSALFTALFFASYMFTVLPAHWDSPYDARCTEYILEVCREDSENIFQAIEIYVIDNSDGTFSHYIDGMFIMYVDADSDFLEWVEVRTREGR